MGNHSPRQRSVILFWMQLVPANAFPTLGSPKQVPPQVWVLPSLPNQTKDPANPALRLPETLNLCCCSQACLHPVVLGRGDSLFWLGADLGAAPSSKFSPSPHPWHLQPTQSLHGPADGSDSRAQTALNALGKKITPSSSRKGGAGTRRARD